VYGPNALPLRHFAMFDDTKAITNIVLFYKLHDDDVLAFAVSKSNLPFCLYSLFTPSSSPLSLAFLHTGEINR